MLRRERDEVLGALRAVLTAVEAGRGQLQWAVEQAAKGVLSADFDTPVMPPPSGDLRADAIAKVQVAMAEAYQGVLKGAAYSHQRLSQPAELASIFQSVAPRLQSLVNGSISQITKIERSVEDPDLLDDLFVLDNMLARIQRAAESMAVLGGKLPSRNAPAVLIRDAIRRAVSATPDYPRVRVALTTGNTAMPGYVSPAVVHVLSELMENATKFSHQQVQIHIEHSEAGLAIEVLDRGTGMSDRKRRELNRLLSAPETVNPTVYLKKGRTGLLVAGLFASRHGITVQLRPDIVGGTRAVVVLPEELLCAPAKPKPTAASAPARGPAPSPAPPRPSTVVPGEGDRLPRRVPTAGDTQGASDGGKPALPRRDTSTPTRPQAPASQEGPAGRPTGSLMANFRSRAPRDGEEPPGSSTHRSQ